MSLPEVPKLLRETTKIGHIFRKFLNISTNSIKKNQSPSLIFSMFNELRNIPLLFNNIVFGKSKLSTNYSNKCQSSSLIFFNELRKILLLFNTKNYFENQNVAIFEELLFIRIIFTILEGLTFDNDMIYSSCSHVKLFLTGEPIFM